MILNLSRESRQKKAKILEAQFGLILNWAFVT